MATPARLRWYASASVCVEPRHDLDPVVDALGLGGLAEQLEHALAQRRAARDRGPLGEPDVAQLLDLAARDVTRPRHVDRDRDIRARAANAAVRAPCEVSDLFADRRDRDDVPGRPASLGDATGRLERDVTAERGCRANATRRGRSGARRARGASTTPSPSRTSERASSPSRAPTSMKRSFISIFSSLVAL